MSTLDITRRGERTFTDDEYKVVVNALLKTTPTNTIKVPDLAINLGMEGRTVRAIVSAADGIEFVLGGGDDGYYVAEWHEDAEPFTRRLMATATALMYRAERRRNLGLPKRQPSLFE